MRSKLIPTVVVLVACGAVALTGIATARGLAETKVTIQVAGRDFSGKVKSEMQRCVTERKVTLIKQKGERGGDDDIKVASDTASANGEWNTGNTGISGKFYAHVGKIPDKCKADNSKTLHTEN